MKYSHGTQTIESYLGKRIVKSGAVGATNVEEVKWLTTQLLTIASGWKTTGWGYIVDISQMKPVTPDVSEELVNLHKGLATNGCKAMAFVNFAAFVTGAQAKEHQKKSNAAIAEASFKTEEEAIAWIETII